MHKSVPPAILSTWLAVRVNYIRTPYNLRLTSYHDRLRVLGMHIKLEIQPNSIVMSNLGELISIA